MREADRRVEHDAHDGAAEVEGEHQAHCVSVPARPDASWQPRPPSSHVSGHMPYSVWMRSDRLELRLSPSERDTSVLAAEAVGETLSEFFRRAARDRARDVIADEPRVELSHDEAARFLHALDEPDQESVERLRELHRHANSFFQA